MFSEREDFAVPKGNYTRETFQKKLVDSKAEIFNPHKKRKWIKIHGVRTRASEWQDILRQFKKEEFGKVWRLGLPQYGGSDDRRPVDFYVCEYSPELLLFYTASANWEYELSLQRFIEETVGLGQMWIGPELFENLILHFMDAYNPTIERFWARRTKRDSTPNKVGRDFSRRVDWGAEDSFETIFELKERYGVRPTAIQMRLADGIFQMNDDGMFVVTRLNSKMFGAFEEAMNFLKVEESLITRSSQTVDLKVEKHSMPKGELLVPNLTTGTITLNQVRLGNSTVSQIMDGGKFDFMDSSTEEGSFSWIATAIDKKKKSVFGVSSDERIIHLIPRYSATFESFLDFYRQIVEEVDPSARFQVPGGAVG